MTFNNFKKKYLIEFLEKNGFNNEPKSNYFIKQVNNDLIQVILFEKGIRGEKKCYLRFSIDMIFLPGVIKGYKLTPGSRDDYFTGTQENLYSYENDVDAEVSKKTIQQMLKTKVFFWLTKNSNLSSILNLYEKSLDKPTHSDAELIHSDESWQYHDMMFINLRLKNYKKAKEYALFLINQEFKRDIVVKRAELIIEFLEKRNFKNEVDNFLKTHSWVI